MAPSGWDVYWNVPIVAAIEALSHQVCLTCLRGNVGASPAIVKSLELM